MARDLHDGLAQELAFIRSQTAAMAAGTVIPGMEQHLSAAAERALAESRRAVDVLSGTTDDAGPLARALCRAAEEVATRAGAAVKVHAEDVTTVPPEVREALVRVTREATNDAVRHGAATTVCIRLRKERTGLWLAVADDGNGFDQGTVRRGHGLRSMRERAEAVGGRLEIRSDPGCGATVEVHVPMRDVGG